MWRKKPHCPILQVGKQDEATPKRLGVAASNQNKFADAIIVTKRKFTQSLNFVLSASWCIIAQNHVKKDIGVNTKYFAMPLRNNSIITIKLPEDCEIFRTQRYL